MSGAGLLRVVGVVVVGAAVVAGSGAVDGRVTVPGAPRAAAPETAPPARPVATRTLVCPGQETVGVPGLPAEPGATPVDLVAVAAPDGVSAARGRELPAGILQVGPTDAADAQRVTAPGSAATARLAGPRSGVVTATQRLAPALAAVQRSLATSGERAALVSVPCGVPVTDAWFPAGAGQAGRQEHLVLTNPHETPVTVDVTLHGATGPIASVAGRDVVVEPRGRTVVLLDALDGTEASPTAQVHVRGGTVHASLHDGWLDGITARGADDVAPSATGQDLVVPGLVVAGPDDPTVVRVAGVADRATEVRVTTLGPNGPVGDPLRPVRIPAGASRDVGLPSLPAGTYGVRVSATAPVAAAAYLGRADGRRPQGSGSVGAPVRDFAWVPAVPALDDLAGLPLGQPEGARLRHRVALTNPGDTAVATTVTVVGGDGSTAPRRVDVPARGTSAVDVGDATSVWVSAAQGVRAAVVSEADGGLVTVAPLVAPWQTTTPYVLSPSR
ncbi:DUF5719 family protein [Arsenicicoccus bolidensis]|uniref:DUF5719 family protein n=1 Tax=Arsenicicoccus bolidensis TaxID=229480 RepID=A0ABS9Q214_9MICO|nr:DUF5719 family protein [Arsenicicoccus bolidensis]MCG7321917.1 DUF5719 family protein [Arsenicicoccus bolidensis]